MKLSVTLRATLAFAGMDALFTPCVTVAFASLFGISGHNATYYVILVIASVKIALWVSLLRSSLAPYEKLVRLPKEAQTPEVIASADEALQRAPLEFGFGYAGLWSMAHFGSIIWLWMLGDDRIPLGSGTAEVVTLVGLAIFLGAFSFAYPLTALLTSAASAECSVLAEERGIALPRRAMPLQLRIALVALCLGLGPTLWVIGLGYIRQIDSAREIHLLRTKLAASEAAGILGRQPEPSLARIAQVVRQIAGPNAQALVYGPDGRGLSTEAAGLLEEVPALSKWFAQERGRAEQGARSLLRAPKTLAFERTPDRFTIAVLLNETPEPSASYVLSATLFAILVGLWGPLCALILGRAASNPIARLARVARSIVEEGRLSEMRMIPIERNDEVGELTHQFNQVLALMRSLSQAATGIARGNLNVELAGKGELPDSFREMIDALRRIVFQLRETSVDLAAAATEILTASQEQEVAAATQSSAMAEISRTVDSLSESAAHVSEAVQNVLSNAERTLENTDEAVRRIGELATVANRIAEILDVIREIADRSDLLALNGSLEASRAGEGAGGFAFVASEMRRLAERVTASVQDVKKLVADIRDSSSSTAVATEESRKLAEGTTQAARQITFVTQQQRSSTEQVSLSVKNVADVVSQAASATTQTRASIGGLKHHADKLADVVKRFDGISAGAG